MNRQHAFNTAYHGLAAQGFERSGHLNMERNDYVCLYRGPDNKRCALGYLIPDEVYNPSFEGQSVTAIGQGLGYSGSDIHFLNKLQIAHDMGETPEQMKNFLHTFAQAHALTIPTITLTPHHEIVIADHENVIHVAPHHVLDLVGQKEDGLCGL